MEEGESGETAGQEIVCSRVKWSAFEALKVSVRKYADENVIIGGDLNCCLAPEDKKGGRPIEHKKQLIDSIISLYKSFNLVDLWRNSILMNHSSLGIISLYQFSVGSIIGWRQKPCFCK